MPSSNHLTLFTGLDCHFLEWDEARSDHTVVLVHGFLDLAWGWARTVEAGLAARYHVVAPDVRGHGDSGRAGPGGYYYIMDYVADLASLVESVGRERVSLVGHSRGGSGVAYPAGARPADVHRPPLPERMRPPQAEAPL